MIKHVIYIFLWTMLISYHSQAQSLLKIALHDSVVKQNTPLLRQAFAEKGLIFGNPVFFRVFKQDDTNKYGHLEVWVQDTQTASYTHFKDYPICYYHGGLGPKYAEGDGRTPEGFYGFTASNINPNSNLFRSFNIGFPNAYDRVQGYTGSFIMIHGKCVAIGCLAMTDNYMAEIWTIGVAALSQGQQKIAVHIFPFPLTNVALNEYKQHENYAFWKQLQGGYLYFEEKHQVPLVSVKNKKYLFR